MRPCLTLLLSVGTKYEGCVGGGSIGGSGRGDNDSGSGDSTGTEVTMVW